VGETQVTGGAADPDAARVIRSTPRVAVPRTEHHRHEPIHSSPHRFRSTESHRPVGGFSH